MPARSIEADVVIVGAGLSGLTAAARLVELGRVPTLLERGTEEAYPCNSRYAGGIFHAAYRDPTAPAGDIAAAIGAVTHGTADPALAAAVAEDGRRLLAWLEDKGTRFSPSGDEDYRRWTLTPLRLDRRGLTWQGRGADRLLQRLEALIIGGGGRLLRGTRALRLDPLANALAVEAEREGSPLRLEARAVVLADGGFQGNADLVRRHVSPRPEALLQRGAGTGRGDGLAMALDLGAATVGLDRFYGHLLHRDAFDNPELWPWPWLDPIALAGVLVGADGRRFVDEGAGGVWAANFIARLADPLSAFVVFDEAIWRGPAAQGLIPPNPNVLEAGGRILSASDLAALAGKMGVPAQALIATVEGHNAALSGGRGRSQGIGRSRTERAMPIATAPFHAIPLCAGLTYTMGGIAIDGEGRVLDTQGAPISRLYAAGCAAGGLEGGSDTSGYVGGLIKSGVTGLRAAEAVAHDISR